MRASRSSRKRRSLGFQSWGNSSRKGVSHFGAGDPALLLADPPRLGQRHVLTPENGSNKMGFRRTGRWRSVEPALNCLGQVAQQFLGRVALSCAAGKGGDLGPIVAFLRLVHDNRDFPACLRGVPNLRRVGTAAK